MTPKAARRVLSLTFAVLLLAAELVALTHPLDAAAHSDAEPCKICLSIGGTDAAAVPHEAPPQAVLAPAVVSPALLLALPAPRREAPAARGPPAFR